MINTAPQYVPSEQDRAEVLAEYRLSRRYLSPAKAAAQVANDYARAVALDVVHQTTALPVAVTDARKFAAARQLQDAIRANQRSRIGHYWTFSYADPTALTDRHETPRWLS